MSSSEKKIIRRRLAGSYVSSVVSISLVLFLLGAAALMVGASRNVADYFRESMQVSVVLAADADEGDAEIYKERIDTLPFVRQSWIVSREEGMEEMKAMLGADFLDIFKDAPIPVSVDVSLKAEYVCPDSLDTVMRGLGDEIVDEIEYQQPMIEKFSANVRKISLVLGTVILVLLFISFVLISNTVRLDVFSRRFNIHTMAMVGATRAFIRRPFIGRAVIQGLVSSLVGIGLTAGVASLALKGFPNAAQIFAPQLLASVAVLLLLCGVLICVISTWFVVNSLVSLDRGELYF